jgi:hypothetical protein
MHHLHLEYSTVRARRLRLRKISVLTTRWGSGMGQVPHLWRARCTVSHVRLTSWLRHLNEAVAFFRDWIELDQADAMPPAMHMPAFSSPDRIIAAGGSLIAPPSHQGARPPSHMRRQPCEMRHCV